MKFKAYILFICIAIGLPIHGKHTMQQTFAMIKPYAVEIGKTDEIIEKIKNAGFAIIAIKYVTLTSRNVHQLYKQYQRRSWFTDYVNSMADQTAVVMILEKDKAVGDWDRYKKSIRQYYYLLSHENNIIHGSDCVKDAKREILLFFKN